MLNIQSFKTGRIVELLIKSLIVILPLFLLPIFSTPIGMDDFSKFFLLWLIAPLVLFLIILKTIKDGAMVVKRLPLDIPIFIFLTIIGIATVFSLNKFASFFGLINNFGVPFLSLVIIVIYYFTVIHLLYNRETTFDYVKLLIFSYVLTLATTLVILFGSWLSILKGGSLLFILFRQSAGFLEDLSIFIAAIDVLIYSFLACPGCINFLFKKTWQVYILKASTLFSLWLLVLINFVPAWWCLIFGIIIFTILKKLFFTFQTKAIYNKKEKNNTIGFKIKRSFWLIFFLVIPVVFLLINYFVITGADQNNRLGQKLQLNQVNTIAISLQAAKNRPLFGYGPNMLNNVISLFRSSELNNTPTWDLRYKSGSSFIFNLLATTGFFGTLSYLLIISLWFFYSIKNLKLLKKLKQKDFNNERIEKVIYITIALIATVASLLVGQFIYSVNFVLLFVFWTLIALVVILWHEIHKFTKKDFASIKKLKKYTQKKNSNLFIFLTFFLFLLFCGWFFVTGLYVKYGIADIYFNKAIGAKGGQGEKYLLRATSLNPNNYLYKISLAKYYLALSLNEAVKQGSLLKNMEFIRDNFNNSIGWAEKAISTSPRSVTVYETLGIIYRNIGEYSPDSLNFAIGAFKEAEKLEPSNPVIALELGNIYFSMKMYDEAVKYYSRAVELKDNYSRAEFGLAKTYIEKTEYNKALETLNKLEGVREDINIYFEQGRVYYNKRDFEEAVNKFRQVIAIEPLHANALYSLGLSLEEVNAKDEALYYYNMVARLNPDNEEVKKKIEGLEGK